jgi:squalene-associated FAD-dependent desaturase
MSPEARSVIVVGGGLAGMACAVALESAGLSVTLLEARKSLGGRAGSFEDPQTAEQLDNCQHVLLGCCTNLIDFYRRIGADSLIQFHRQIHFRDERGKRYDLFGIPHTSAPLHLGPSLLRFSALTWHERLKLSEAMLHMAQTNRDDVADVSFGEWLDAHGQPESLVRKFYDAVIISGLNEDTRRASAAYAIQIFQESLLANRAAYVVGMPKSSLGELYATMEGQPGVRLGTRVSEIRFDRDRVTGVELQNGEVLTAGAYVIATNHHAVQKWVPAEIVARDSRFASLDRFDSVPILGVHLWFDRPVLRESHAALMRGPLQWVFRKDAEGKALHGVISAARDFVDRPKDQMLGEFEKQVRETFAEAREAKLLRGVIVIEKRATFSPTPGIDRIRPPQAAGLKGIQNLLLAGDYTQTAWPATMEGAVRSGYLAAEAITGKKFLVPNLTIEWPARLLGYRG